MPKRHGQLIERVADMDNLRAAFAKAARGKHATWGYLEFKEFAQANLAAMRERILDGTWVQGAGRCFTVFEPKRRLITALGFQDRVAQHALVNVIGPIFEAALLPSTFACRAGMGTHAGVRHVQSSLRRTGATHFLKTDFRAFFASVDRVRLHRLIERRIKCRPTLALIEAMVPREGKGLPIGSLTSQLFANVYGAVVDRFIHFELGAQTWARYMDDIVVLSANPYELREWFDRIEEFSAQRLGLQISRWQVSPVARGINFLGFRIWARHKLLRKNSVVRAKRTISRRVRAGDREGLARFVAAWSGHARHADTCNLFNYLEGRYGVRLHQQPR